jgi:hypothetical protein
LLPARAYVPTGAGDEYDAQERLAIEGDGK